MIMKTVTDTEKKMPAVEGGRQGEDAVGSAIFTPIIVDPSVSCQAKRAILLRRVELYSLVQEIALISEGVG